MSEIDIACGVVLLLVNISAIVIIYSSMRKFGHWVARELEKEKAGKRGSPEERLVRWLREGFPYPTDVSDEKLLNIMGPSLAAEMKLFKITLEDVALAVAEGLQALGRRRLW